MLTAEKIKSLVTPKFEKIADNWVYSLYNRKGGSKKKSWREFTQFA